MHIAAATLPDIRMLFRKVVRFCTWVEGAAPSMPALNGVAI
jgi:hypothetical protein